MIPASEDRNVEQARVDSQAITSDHLTLRRLMERLNEMLGKLVAHDMSEEPEMLRLVASFRDVVCTHFEREEASGVLEQAAEHEPRFSDRVDALIAEHAKMRSALEALCEDAPGPSWGDFEVRFGAFCETLGAHEQAESEVLMGAYLDDLGGHN